MEQCRCVRTQVAAHGGEDHQHTAIALERWTRKHRHGTRDCEDHSERGESAAERPPGLWHYGMHREAIAYRARAATAARQMRTRDLMSTPKADRDRSTRRRRIFPLGSSTTADVRSPKSPAHRDGVADDHKAIRRSSEALSRRARANESPRRVHPENSARRVPKPGARHVRVVPTPTRFRRGHMGTTRRHIRRIGAIRERWQGDLPEAACCAEDPN